MNKLLHEIHRLRKLIRDAQSEIELAPRVLKAHQTKLAGLETALADGKEAMKKAKANILTLEANIKSTTHAIAKHEKQLDGLTAPREIAAKETDIKTAKAQIAQHEEELMAAMTDADDRTARIPDLEAALAKGKLDFAAYEKAATDRAKRLKSELTSATKTLTEEDKKIPTDMRNSYDRLVRGRPRIAFLPNGRREVVQHVNDLIVTFDGMANGRLPIRLYFKGRVLLRQPHLGDADYALGAGHFHPTSERQSEAAVERRHATISEQELAGHFDIDAVEHVRASEDLHGLGPESPADAEDGVAADIEKAAAAEPRLEADIVGCQGIHSECERRRDPLNFADGTIIDQFAHRSRSRMVWPHEAIHEADALGPAIGHEVGGLGGRWTQRLFAQNVLAVVGCFPRPLGVQRVRQWYVHGIDRTVGEQFLVSSVCHRASQVAGGGLRPLERARRNGVESNRRRSLKSRLQAVVDFCDAENAPAKFPTVLTHRMSPNCG